MGSRPAKGERTPGSGRKKGSVNKTTADMREMMYQAFELAGGVEYLVSQARVNPKAFLSMASRLIPQASEHKIDGNLPLLVLSQDYVKGETRELKLNEDGSVVSVVSDE